MLFLRKSNLERLPVAMSGVRMGERVLQIGIDDPSLAGAIAAKVGLSGHAALAVSDASQEARARAGAARAGALVDVQVTQFDALPFADDSFDVAVLHAAGLAPSVLAGQAGVSLLGEVRRALRSGGRAIVIEGGGPRGVLRRRTPPPAQSAMLATLESAGFTVVRLLAEREGHRFFEALKA
jgi:demethylmenaquinone methyltransferase/2-methoxy-6-polyprenyl-1,4-benzoquinol methylase